MPEPMNDNARIVREVIALFANLHPWPLHKDQRAEIDRGLAALTALESELAAAKAREAGLTKALAEVQAELARAREEERERIIAIITDPHNNILWVVPGSSRVQAIHADPRMIRAALAPEQKGHPETTQQ